MNGNADKCHLLLPTSKKITMNVFYPLFFLAGSAKLFFIKYAVSN